MALARIITRSHACSRELALDLLARGYAVEIISPDKIPDNIADLELRVDTAPGDQLIANVEAHSGERSASLEFVHHLKAPMVDFIRRPPDPESFPIPQEPVSLIAEPGTEPVIESVDLPAEASQPAAMITIMTTTVSPATETPVEAERDLANPIPPPNPLPSPPVEPPRYFAVNESPLPLSPIAPPAVEPATVRPVRRPAPPAGWLGRAVLSFASVVLLALVLGFGVHRTGKASAQGSGAPSAEKLAAASIPMTLLSAPDAGKDPGQFSAVPAPPAVKSEGNFDHAPKQPPVTKSQVAKPEVATPGSRTRTRTGISRRPSHDLIAPDTVTYLDGHTVDKPATKSKAAKPLAHRHPASHKHGGVIAANNVTYLSQPPKAAK